MGEITIRQPQATGKKVQVPGCSFYEYDLTTRKITGGRIYFDFAQRGPPPHHAHFGAMNPSSLRIFLNHPPSSRIKRLPLRNPPSGVPRKDSFLQVTLCL